MKTKIVALLLALVTLTSMIAMGVAYAMPVSMTSSSLPTQASWVRLTGQVTKWGTTDVRGQLFAQARTALLSNMDTRQFARSTVVWTKNLTRAISTVKAKENFTYTFYSAALLNASVSSLSFGSNNFFLNGTWNVATVNSKVTVTTDDSNNIVSVHRDSTSTVTKVYGELTVTDNWTKFKLQLTGFDALTGTVSRSVTKQTMFNWAQVTDGTATAVTRADVNAVIQCYNAMPGWGSYDNRMDFNFNYKIDIADVVTVAANL